MCVCGFLCGGARACVCATGDKLPDKLKRLGGPMQAIIITWRFSISTIADALLLVLIRRWAKDNMRNLRNFTCE